MTANTFKVIALGAIRLSCVFDNADIHIAYVGTNAPLPNKGKSKSAINRREIRNRLHVPVPGETLTIGKTNYLTRPDGSIRRISSNCFWRSPFSGLVCTRVPNHAGDHIAHGVKNNILERWSSK